MTDEEILNLPLMQNTEKLAAVRYFVLANQYITMYKPLLAAIGSLRTMTLVLDHGHCAISPLVLAGVANIMIASPGGMELGMRMSRLSLEMLSRSPNRAWLPRTYLALHGFSKPFTQSTRHSLEPVMEAYRVGLSAGDIESSMYLAGLYAGLAIYSSIPLKQLRRDLERFLRLIQYHNQHSMSLFMRPNLQYVLNVLGLSTNPVVLSGDAMDEDALLSLAIERKTTLVMSVVNVYKLQLCGHFQEFEMGRKLVHVISQYKAGTFAPYIRIAHLLHSGIVLTSSGRRLDRWAAKRCLKLLRKRAKWSKDYVTNKVLLLEAVILEAEGHFDEDKYRESVRFARADFLWSEAGMANEYWAQALVTRGRLEDARSTFSQAVEDYEKWEADGLIQRVRKKMEAL